MSMPSLQPRRRTGWTAVLVLLGLLVASPPVRAQGDRGAKLLLRAEKLHGQGEFTRAIKVLRRAASLARDPALLARIHGAAGVNYHVINRKQKARDAFVKALSADPLFTLDADRVGKATVALLAQVRQSLQGTLRVECERPARVILDGEQKGRAPVELSAAVGAHQLRLVSVDGLWACHKQVVVRRGGAGTQTCKLLRLQGKLSVVSVPAGAEVLLGGEPMGKTPLDGVAAPVGQHELRLRLEGYQEQVLTVTVSTSAAVARAVELKKVAVTRPPVTTPPVTTPPVTTPPVTTAAPRPPARERLWTWVAAGSALAAAVAGAVLIGVVESHVDEWDGISDGADPRLDELEDAIPREAWARNIMLAAAGALAATAVVLYFLEGRSTIERPSRKAARTGPIVVPAVGQGAGVMVSIPF